MINDYIVSIIRTLVPVLIASLLTTLGVKYNIVLDENTSAQLTVGIIGLLTSVYYAVVRGLELKWPKLGVFLGSTKAPNYVPTVDGQTSTNEIQSGRED